MANIKISELPVAPSVTLDDLIVIVNDPNGTPNTQKASIQQIVGLAENNNFRTNRGVIETTGSQNTFNVAGGYIVGALDVFLNGVKLVVNVDFIASNGSNFQILSSVPAGNIIEYVSLASLNASGISTDQYSATISRDIINVTTNNLNTITVTGGYDIGGIDVYKNGLKLIRGVDFTANDGSTISFNQTPQQGSVIEYVSFISGKSRRSINRVSSSLLAGSAPQTDYIYVAVNPIVITLPSVIGNNNRYTIKNLSIGEVTVVSQPGQLIDGNISVKIIDQYTSIDLVGDSQNWIII
jgi:hypothetical protein